MKLDEWREWRVRLPVNPFVLVALLVAIGWAVPKMRARAKLPADALAFTECPWFSGARVTVSPSVSPEDVVPVRDHENVHAAQCRDLGPVRYRVRNLRASGRLSLEAPAYCAGARARLMQGTDAARVRERVVDDATAAFHDDLDSTTVLAALGNSCPEVLSR